MGRECIWQTCKEGDNQALFKNIFLYRKSLECTEIGGLLAEFTDAQAIKKLTNFWDISDNQREQIEFHTDWGFNRV